VHYLQFPLFAGLYPDSEKSDGGENLAAIGADCAIDSAD
jgi:hypothetical protein